MTETLRQRAVRAITEAEAAWSLDCGKPYRDLAIAQVEAALREEREACAKIADDPHAHKMTEHADAGELCAGIAAVIRARP